VKLNSC